MKLDAFIPKDTVVLFSSGEYSDYNTLGLYKAVQDIKPEEVRNDYINAYPEQSGKYGFKTETFINFLKEKNLFEQVPGPTWKEWYLGGYSCISDMKVYEGPILFN